MKRWLAALLLAGSGTVAALPDIQVQGLMPGRAVLSVEGQMQVLREGETSPEGITIIAADSQAVTIEYDGERHQLGLTSRAGTGCNRLAVEATTSRRASVSSSRLSVRSRSKTLETATNNVEVLRQAVRELFEKFLGESELKIRRVGVKISHFAKEETEQKRLTSFFQST